MMTDILSDPSHRPQFSGHETFPLRQLWLLKAYAAITGGPSVTHSGIFSDEDAIVRFGVGKNMVTAIKHWALACDMIENHAGKFYPTEIARRIFSGNGLDPYNEHPATTWLIHWILAGRGSRSTTWFWLFNHVAAQTFDRKTIFSSIKEFLVKKGGRLPTDTTLRRDIECCIRSYIPRLNSESLEEIAEPVLGELGLIYQGSHGTLEFRRGQKHTLPDGIFTFALLEFWARFSPDTTSLSFEAIAHEFGSPGRVFKLDENSVVDRLIMLDQITRGCLVWSETSGMRQVIRTSSDNLDKLDMLSLAYA